MQGGETEGVQRIAIVGGPGSGKTTMATALSQSLGLPRVELDGLWWGPHWTPKDPSTFLEEVRALTRNQAWILDGNYFDEVGRSVIWPAADVLVWLDLPRWKCVARAVRRTALRAARRSDLWGTNRQSFGDVAPKSIARLFRRWPSYSAAVERILSEHQFPELNVVRLRTDQEVRRWLSVYGVER
jgi:adenylate kinase family enzyme